MEFIKQKKKYKVNLSYLKAYLNKFWYIPSDALQRGIEANIWGMCKFQLPVLDIGVGDGQISKFIFKNKSKIDVGIDIDDRGFDKARATKKYHKVICASAEKMPFEDRSFNSVVSNSTFEHIKNDIKAVSEVARVLKKEGLFFLTVPSKFLKQWILEYESDINKIKAKKKLNNFNRRTRHLRYRSFSEWEKIFTENNLKIIFYKYYFPKDVALYWYKLFKIFTLKIGNRELWSYLGESKITKFFPKNIVIELLESIILKKPYENAFFTNTENGAQLFIVAKKT